MSGFRRDGDGNHSRPWLVAHRLRERFPDGQLYASLRGPNPLVRLAKVRIRLGHQPEDLLRHAWSTCHSMQDGFGQGLALRTLGELELARERPEQACRYLELSVRWWEVLPLWRARSLRTLSAAFTALGRTGDSDRAHVEAHAVFLRTGAREAAEEPLRTVRRIP